MNLVGVIIPKGKRGKLEIINSNVKCFLGKKGNFKPSEDIWKELKVKEIIEDEIFYQIEDEKYLIIFPIPEKKNINNYTRWKII